MSQRYHTAGALGAMSQGLCPECAGTPEAHSNDNRFWIHPRSCSLTFSGVTDRIAQFEEDEAARSTDQIERGVL